MFSVLYLIVFLCACSSVYVFWVSTDSNFEHYSSCNKWRRGRDFVDSMAAKLIGQVREFVGQEEWLQYAERVDHYFVANDVDVNGDEKKSCVPLLDRPAVLQTTG